ncbi:3' terminal RNA ribose 2'-O-methyltransferase Hen1 [Curtobacterium sp. MCBD17_034]|uniref:3' terminal RNA ribose 2'-O-methyltransferase Hen1 n=1 Tax=unclassified Curtobacterium TaxID=257496 RepID=UPI000DAA104D|nr:MULTISPECIES: 3' terminal RNA ribose 2'-O-methyltransferase Hen1 [unclassified Curtobacterium]PZF62289.1 3' terminal RNA ribose 2'-O-methyltransferase Hen1 [Curtobacterium sp. MCBD17_034]PZM40004.1 3' terminal RNA ribose 2'-O-methyltransferase Hen1 [Curtobacterium sp. MCBD17_031]
MLVTITTTGDTDPGGVDALDLGHLLHKHPGRAQTFSLSVGDAHVFYPEATSERCTAALLLEVDPVGLARSRRFGGDTLALAQYVNDRPYASSSMVAVAIGQVFRTAMGGRSTSLPERSAAPMPLEVTLTSVPSELDQDGTGLATRLFAPLGWDVEEHRRLLDETHPAWGPAPTVGLTLRGTVRLGHALRHLYVLLPVLDDAKHYWVNDDEVGKLLRAGEGWLADHPLRDLITTRYLAHQRGMVVDATDRLLGVEDVVGETVGAATADRDGAATADREARHTPDDPAAGPDHAPLYRRRADAVMAALHDVGAHTVADLGCGEGELLMRLKADRSFTTVIGSDVSPRELARAERRLHLDEASDAERARIRLVQSSVTYLDDRIAGLDAAVLMEVVEHVDPGRLPALEVSVFAVARPGAVIVTTPNAEHNVRFPHLDAGHVRHEDHRFEWTRGAFRAWSERVAADNGYVVEYRPVGDDDAEVGPPTQMAVFRRSDLATAGTVAAA